jgi:hypothetical protein
MRIREFKQTQPSDLENDELESPPEEDEVGTDEPEQPDSPEPVVSQPPTPAPSATPITAPTITEPIPAAVVPATTDSNFGSDVKELIAKNAELTPGDPKKSIIDKFLSLVASYLPMVDEVTSEAISISKLSSSDMMLVTNANIEYLNAMIAKIAESDPETAAKFEAMARDLISVVSKDKNVIRANLAAIKGIQLNTKGQIAKLDKDIEEVARQFAEKFNVKLIWARNLVGMFSVAIEREDRKKFLDLCLAGEAMDINKMITAKQGPIDEVVATQHPEVQKVFQSIKDTLLDISLSTGQRGATGPFEAMLAIMGGATKPSNEEGGDLVIKGLKYEVKSTSITVSSSSLTSGGMSAAWLDAGPQGEVGGSKLRAIATDYISDNFPQLFASPAFKARWKTADFLSKGLEDLNAILDGMEKRKPGGAAGFLKSTMLGFFPNSDKAKTFNFNKCILRMLAGIRAYEPHAVAKEQGILALIEYHIGKGNDGFILFNSSIQEYRVITGIDGIIEAVTMSPDESNIHFPSPMTMGTRAKASPAIYYGPHPTSSRGKEYITKFNSDPKRAALVKSNLERKKQEKQSK